MHRDPRFDDIRPYYDEEVPAAMQRIAASPYFPQLSAYVFPEMPVEQAREMVAGIRTVDEFQTRVMWYVNLQVIRRSISELTWSGAEGLSPEKRYLFVSNHRDIMLDASLLQNILHIEGHETSEISFGANLMSSQLLVDIGCSNKMFRVERGGTVREMYNSSVHLSEYIRYAIGQKNQSVWIAQRNGRTKNGDDRTDQGVIKMFGMSSREDPVEALDSLHIAPVSVSYEWEPCDVAKALELYCSRAGAYVKKPGEDLTSILTGLLSPKGRVHFTFCPPLRREELSALSGCPSVEFNRKVAELVDRRIWSGYKLTPNNFIAYDLCKWEQRYLGVRYTEEDRSRFLDHLDILGKCGVEEPDALRDIFLQIYARPVDNCLEGSSQE